MDIDTRTLACWAENAWDDCAATPSSLRDQLRLMERNASSLFASGSIGSVSKNSASQSYAGSGFGRFSVVQIQQGFRMLIELYDWLLQEATFVYQSTGTCHDNFVAKYPTFAEDPDQAVYDAIALRLGNPVDYYETDLSYLRLRPTLGGPFPQTW